MSSDLKDYKLLRLQKVANGYVGTSLQETEICKLQAVSKPLSDSLSAEIYGERVKNMIELTILKINDIEIYDGDIIVNESSQKYKVISVSEYSEHYIVVGEKL